MDGFPPNINPEIFSITAVIVGLIIEDDYTSNELNSIGNWLILVGQLTLTTAAQQQLINGRYQENTGSRIKSNSNDHTVMNKPFAKREELNSIYQRLYEIERELNELEKY
jgi:hypothetical protein